MDNDTLRRSGIRGHKLYRVWRSLRERCNNPRHISYQYYGGKGVTVCREWDCYEYFFKWAIEHGWEEGLQIDRINNKVGYCPSNCRFVTVKEQSINRSHAHLVTIGDETYCISEWADRLDVPYSILRDRATRSSYEEVIEDIYYNGFYYKTGGHYKYLTIDGVRKSFKDWAETIGVKVTTIYDWNRCNNINYTISKIKEYLKRKSKTTKEDDDLYFKSKLALSHIEYYIQDIKNTLDSSNV